MNVVLIGTGNVATVLGSLIAEAGHSIRQVLGRSGNAAALLGGLLNCPSTTEWNEIDRNADLYLICLADSALPDLGERLQLPDRLVLHTAGAVPMKVLWGVSRNCGVLYPLQSLRKEIRPFPPVPLLVDAAAPESLPLVMEFAGSISDRVQVAGDEMRLRLHVGAVIVNNFTNYLYIAAADYCRTEGIDFGLYGPLIMETASRVAHFPPEQVQTGPARRGDLQTIESHLSILDNHLDIRKLYKFISDRILEHFHHG